MPNPNYLPIGCITSGALYSLAAAMNRLASWHKSHGGPSHDCPCLRIIEVNSLGQVTAKVHSGDMHWDLILKNGDWQFVAEAVR